MVEKSTTSKNQNAADLIFEIDVEFKRAFSCSSLPRTAGGKDAEG